ncbi:hypothetical protein SALBM135S_10126 [Streptomyces alboniger]
MRVRNALWRPPFVMYYRTFGLAPVRADLAAAGFEVRLLPLEEFGRRPDGSPHWRLVVARRGARSSRGGPARRPRFSYAYAVRRRVQLRHVQLLHANVAWRTLRRRVKAFMVHALRHPTG